MKVVAIIQSRMGSKRLPGKSLLPIADQPLLGHVIDRAKGKIVDEVLVATTLEPEDDSIIEFCVSKGVHAFRGSAEDVLDRFYQAALASKAELVVRITADDPFKDPAVIDRITDIVRSDESLDYASNTLEPTFPEGLDIEVFRFRALERAWREARLPSEREHVTPYIWKQPTVFRLKNVNHSVNLSHLRWTIDYPEDLQFAREVYKRLYSGQVFGIDDILKLLSREPELSGLNAGFTRNAGYVRSVADDLSFL